MYILLFFREKCEEIDCSLIIKHYNQFYHYLKNTLIQLINNNLIFVNIKLLKK